MNEKNLSPEQLVAQLSEKHRVGPRFVNEVSPMINEILNGGFSDHEKKSLFRLVEDAFRRQAEIELTHKVTGMAFEQLAKQNEEKHLGLPPVQMRGRMDDPVNRISRNRRGSITGPDFEDYPFQN